MFDGGRENEGERRETGRENRETEAMAERRRDNGA